MCVCVSEMVCVSGRMTGLSDIECGRHSMCQGRGRYAQLNGGEGTHVCQDTKGRINIVRFDSKNTSKRDMCCAMQTSKKRNQAQEGVRMDNKDGACKKTNAIRHRKRQTGQ